MRPRVWGEGTSPDGSLPCSDRGALWGQGLFETTRLLEGRAWLWTAHLDRLTRSAVALDLPLPAGDWRERVTRGLAGIARGLGFGRVRLTLTAGDAAPDGDPARPPVGPPRLLLQVWPFVRPPAEAAVLPVARLIPVGPPQAADGAGLGGHKTMAWFERLHALTRARAAGGDEGLHQSGVGLVLGASRANIFIVRDGALLTPSLTGGALPGITRALLISTLAPALGVVVHETDLASADVRDAEAILLSNSLWGVRPAIWGTPTIDPGVHPLTRALAIAARNHLRTDCSDSGGRTRG